MKEPFSGPYLLTEAPIIKRKETLNQG